MKKKIEPITPKEVKDNLVNVIPKEIIATVNELLKSNYRGGDEITILAEDIIKNSKLGLTSSQIYQKKYLDFEKIYKEKGWIVQYFQPDRDESFKSYFKFKFPIK